MKVLVVIGPLVDGILAPPEPLGPLTAEININHMELCRRTMTYWPSAVIPPFGLSEGYIWIWEVEGQVRLWNMVSVH